ncbi:hypothetical protein Metlim_1407 [Methanoplanus limicola DSM 2279]|uniref:Uncharacterized protein n=1 Tax=Methanoplanus limicola DSM 2279 TaxID=937775 RepID=H1Z2I7_9EURY|nr:hypothetical protein Metlim_1407 [Methanoplanus limicola DSM 2279]
MKPKIHNNHFCLLSALSVIFCLFSVVPCYATPTDIEIPIQASITSKVFVCTDDNLVATYIGKSCPPEIKVFYPDGTHYKTIQLSNETSDLEYLQISDDRLYYTEYDRSVIWTSRTKTVYEYNMTTNKKSVIYSAGFYNNVEPRIVKIAAHEDYVIIYEEFGGSAIILHKLSTGTNRTIFTSNKMIHGLSIDGDRIMWGCERTDGEPGREIHVYNISSGRDYIIPESRSIKTWGYGDISEDYVVWSRTAEEPDTSCGHPSLLTAGCEILLTDLNSGDTTVVEEINTISTPYISGDQIAYLKKPELDFENTDTGLIRIYDLKKEAFTNAGSDVAGISDFDGEMLLWYRFHPASHWMTAISGNIPDVTDQKSIQDNQEALEKAQNIRSQHESPIDFPVIISALIIDIVYLVSANKRE